jgi:2-C-methyl-D-erythritol 4-phosphate cytidylyltransferase
MSGSVPVTWSPARMQIHAIVLAGGDGNRYGGEMTKQFVRLAGDPILLRTLRRFGAARLDRVVVVSHPRWLDETRRLVGEADLGVEVRVVAGGATRNESTRNGIAALEAADEDIVLVHDAVRPLLPLEVIQRSVEPIVSGRAEATDTVIPSADTLVIVDGEDVLEIPDRSRYRRGQTPQTFRVGVLKEAYAAAERAGDLAATDDCSLVLRYVPSARMLGVAGDEINLKITTRIDMVMADRMPRHRSPAPACTWPAAPAGSAARSPSRPARWGRQPSWTARRRASTSRTPRRSRPGCGPQPTRWAGSITSSARRAS